VLDFGLAKPSATQLPALDTRRPAVHTDGMTMEKIAISLPGALAQRARRAVRKGRATSVSAYVASALEEKGKLDDLAALFDEMLAESGGPLTPTERRTADRALAASAPRPRKR
jgi:predicted phage gp36 major capsid-like protein